MEGEDAGLYEEALGRIRLLVREEIRLALAEAAEGAPAPDNAPAPVGEVEGRVISGDVNYFRLPEVLQLVSLQRLTGRLSLWNGAQSVDIYMRDGLVAYAAGEKRGRREQIGTILVNMGRASQAAIENALEKAASTGRRLGRLLVEDGVVSREDLRSALLKQTERSVYRAMAWGEGRFCFDICALPEFALDVPVDIRVEELILEGVRRIEEGRVIAEKIPSLDMVFRRADYADEELVGMRLKDEERAVLALVDGKLDVRGLVEAAGLAEFSLMRALYALYSAGIIKKVAPAMKSADRTQYL